ncbi:MAG: hypothetical protein L0K01_03645 [Brachybacterium sp.]|nr:hypothetical protein [Brachybacterium sp.]
MSTELATVLAAAFTTLGVIGAGLGKALVQMRASQKAGVSNESIREMDPAPVDGFVDLTEGLWGEIARLREDQREDRELLQQTRRELAETRKEILAERTLREVAVDYIGKLHAWISRNMQDGERPPQVPEELAPHIDLPSR